MADAQLSVELTAKIDQLKTAFGQAGKEVSNFAVNADGQITGFTKNVQTLERQLKVFQSGLKTSLDPSRIVTLNNAIQVTKERLAQTNSVIKGVGLKNFTKGTTQAGMALTDLSRIAQDAPYGFIGIQNNINPLIESFGRLKAETGSTGGALKALAGGLIGPAGLGLAIGVVSAAIVAYQQYQQRSNKAVKEAKTDTDAYVNSLSQLDQVRVKGAQNALKERTELATLYGITQDVTLSQKQRLDAVNELQNKYPEYFKNLKDENILNGEAKDAYDRLSLSILATARARAAQDLITKNSSRQLENEQKIIDIRIKQQQAVVRLQKAEAALAKGSVIVSGGTAAGTGDANARMTRVISARNELRDIDKQIYDLATDTSIVNERNLKLSEAITNQVKQGADLSGGIGDLDTTKTTKDIRTVSDVLKDLNIDLKQAEQQFGSTFDDVTADKIGAYQKAIDDLVKLGVNPASEAFTRLKNAQAGLLDLGGTLGNVPKLDIGSVLGLGEDGKPTLIQPRLQLKPIILGVSEFTKQFEALNDDLSKLALDTIGGTLSNFSSSIGEALISGGNVVDALGMSLLKGFGGFLSEYGRLLIAYGTAAVLKSKLDAAALIPGAGLIAGPAAIAAGIALQVAGSAIGSFVSGGGNKKGDQNSFQAPTAFANGGVIYGPTLGLMGEYAGAKNDPEVVAPLSKLKSILGETSEDGSYTPQGTPKMAVYIENRFKNGDLVTAVRMGEANLKRKS